MSTPQEEQSIQNIPQENEESRDRGMTQNIYKQENTFTIYMHKDNNILHKIFETETATKIEAVVGKKLWMLAAIIPLISTFIAGSLYSNGIISQSVSYIISLPFNITINIWLISHLFMLNLSMAKRLVLTFDFVYKTFNALICIISQFIVYQTESDIFNTSPVLTVFWAILVVISVILTIALISSLDGWRVSVLFKTVFLGVFVFIMMAYSILSYFTFPEHLIIVLGHTLSVRTSECIFKWNIYCFFIFWETIIYSLVLQKYTTMWLFVYKSEIGMG
eukprot:424324_1